MGSAQAGISGTWEIEVSTQLFGRHPATLTVEPEGGGFTGRIDSRLGAAPLTDISPTAGGFEATVSLVIQGRTYDARVTADLDGERIDGRIKVNIPMTPTARFTGTRAAAG